ncbi:MAG TPA: fasciclin domain-containing protein [Myxococcaceae bacterium]|nr:fasciclin domain-containing protein [Myxococcaceae bacterium]
MKWLKDGQKLGQVNGGKVTIGVKSGKVTVNGANVLASIRASNGIVHVIDAVLLPESPKK